MRRSAEDRLQRLLVMLPWLMEQGEVPVVEVAKRFGLTPQEVAAELELAAMCGLPPFVDEMIDVFIDDDVVVVGVPRLFTRPLRLTAPEGFALRRRGAGGDAAARRRCHRAAREGLGQARRRARRRRRRRRPAAPVGGRRPDRAARGAAKRGERLAVRYWTASRDEVTERTITPRRIVSDRGEWYVEADDQRSGERRTFRIDRFETLEATGEREDAPVGAAASGPIEWFVDGSLPQVTLRLRPAAQWVVERYPVDRVVERADGDLEATFPVASDRWLERLLLRLGEQAEVLSPTAWRTRGAVAARRVLRRYEA